MCLQLFDGEPEALALHSESSPVRHWMPFRVRALYQYLEDGPGLVCRACVDAMTDLVRRFQQNAVLYTERRRCVLL